MGAALLLTHEELRAPARRAAREVGLPARGHRRARSPLRVGARRAAPLARDPDRGRPRARARAASSRRISPIAISTAASRARCRSPRASSGSSVRPPLTVTGGLTFGGGPMNNYVMHGIARMAEVLRGDPGAMGLVTGNGGYLTKHAFCVYSTAPPERPFAHEDLQAQVDALPKRERRGRARGRRCDRGLQRDVRRGRRARDRPCRGAPARRPPRVGQRHRPRRRRRDDARGVLRPPRRA